MRHAALILSLLVSLLTLAPARAAQDAPAPPPAAAPVDPGAPAAAPDTPAGHHLRWLLDTLNSPDTPIDTADRFAPEFLTSVPEERIHELITQIRAAFKGFDLTGVHEASPLALKAQARARANNVAWVFSVAAEEAAPHRIAAMLLRPAPVPGAGLPPITSWADADAVVNALGERRALAIYEVADDGALTPLHENNADTPLPTGSAFKLYVLGALAERIASGAAGAPAWAAPLAIADADKSLPGGVMQNLAAGTEKPILEFATRMISISDNTATDHLMRLLGRERIEAFYSSRVAPESRRFTLPFLSTREIFALKLGAPETLAAYADAPEDARRVTLATGGPSGAPLDSTLVALESAAGWASPRAVDRVEWFASTKELCAVMRDLWRMSHTPGLNELEEALSRSSGIGLDEDIWDLRLFKGGSEPGVMNLTWLVQRADTPRRSSGARYALSLSIMDTRAPVDEVRVVGLAQSIFTMLERR